MQAIGRWGNYFNQELYGPPTTLPWGIPIDCAHRLEVYACAAVPGDDALPPAVPVRVDLGAHRRGLPHLARVPARERLRPGDLLLIFFIWYGTTGFLLEILREDNWTVLRRPDRPSSCRCAFIVIGIGGLIYRHRPGHVVGPAGGQPAGRDLGRARGDLDDEADRRAVGERRRPATTRRGDRLGRDIDDRSDDDDRRRRRRRRRLTTGRRRRRAAAGRAARADDRRRQRRRIRRRPSLRPARPATVATAAAGPHRPGGAGRRPRRRPGGPRLARPRRRRRVASLPVPPRPPARPVRRASACSASGSGRTGRSTSRAGGYLLVAAAHRGWMDPFVVMHALPAEPRAWFLGSGPSTFTAPWREWLIQRIGGLLPVWRGGVGHRPARRVGTGGPRQRRGLRADARGHRQRAAGPARGVPHTAGRSSPCAPTRRSCPSRWPAPRSSTSAGGWRRASCRRRPSASWPGCRPTPRCPRPAPARSSTLARAMTDALAARLGAGRRGAPPVDGRPAGPSAPPAPAADLAVAPPRPPRPGLGRCPGGAPIVA